MSFDEYLRRLQQAAGHPSTRDLGEWAGISHTTVAEALNGKRLPSWEKAMRLIHVLDGDPKEGRPLWVAERAKIAMIMAETEGANASHGIEYTNELLERIAVALEKIADRD